MRIDSDASAIELASDEYFTPSDTEIGGIKIDELLRLAVDKGATDVHLKVPTPPVFRIDGILTRQEDLPPLTPEDLRSIFRQITSPDQSILYDRNRELDFAYTVAGTARFRVSAMQQRGTISLVFRLVPIKAPSISELGLPKICRELILKPKGLILVTGPAGSGKSTTLAAMINHLNENKHSSVITIEDPIEYLFRDDKCIIRQRDLGDDTESFYTALVHALRHDPDVIVVGEMRDLETVSIAMTAAETGHLVIATLHTVDAAQSVDRIIDLFPPAQQRQIRLQLSQVLEAVISQTLLPRIGGGRAAAFEIMLGNSVIRKLIREEKVYEINQCIEMSRLEGMQTLNQALAELVKKDVIEQEVALSKSSDSIKLQQLIQSDGKTSSFEGTRQRW